MKKMEITSASSTEKNKKTKKSVKKNKVILEEIQKFSKEKNKKFDYLKNMSDEKLINLIKSSKNKQLQKAAIEQLTEKVLTGRNNEELFESYLILLKYSSNNALKEKLLENINKPAVLEWVIKNSNFEDTKEKAKKRLKEILNRPKI